VEAGEWMRATAAVAAPSFGCVLLDPPRSGADAGVMRLLAEWVPDNIVYVSCDPQTLVRDLALLPVRDYRIAQITGLDLFPQTYHFETVVHLMRRT
jgi:23S rRNA (uracil1939-C5)-methyltransferase